MSKALIGYLSIMGIALASVAFVAKPLSAHADSAKPTVQQALEKRKQALEEI